MPLDFLILHRTNRHFGGGPGGDLADILTQAQMDLSASLARIEIEIAHNGSVDVTQDELSHRRPGLAWVTPSHFPPLARKASIRQDRTRRVLTIVHLSTRIASNEAFLSFTNTLTTDLFHRAFDDVLDALAAAFARRAASLGDFDAPACLAALRQLRGERYASDDDLRRRVLGARDWCIRRRQALDPWQRLDIDWNRFHPSARARLDDPADWDEGDEFSPHGNDAGADILADWSTFAGLSPTQAGAALDLPPYSASLAQPFRKEWVDVHLALAFGHLKMSGQCPPHIADATRAALGLERTRVAAQSNWAHRDAWLARLDRYDRILSAFV